MHKIRVVILLVVMCGMILWPEVVQAKLVTIEIEVVVDSVLDAGGYLEGKVEAGDIITGWYTYDTSTPDSSPSATWGSYEYYTPPMGYF